MLQKFRDRVHGGIAAVLFVLLAISFAFWGVSSYLGSAAPGGKLLAQVGEQSIHQAQLDIALKQAQRQGQVPVNATAKARQQIQRAVLHALVEQAAQVEAARRQGLYIGTEQIKQVIATAPVFQSQGHFSKTLFMSMLSSNNMRESDLINHIKNQMLLSQLSDGLINTDFVLPDELKAGYIMLNQTRNIRYIKVAASSFMQAQHFTDNDIKQYYQQHQTDYRLPAQVRLAYMVLSPDKIRAQVKVSDAQVKNYYAANVSSFYTPERWKVLQLSVPLVGTGVQVKHLALQKAQGLIKQVNANKKTFSSLAKQYGGQTQPRWVDARTLNQQAQAALQGLQSSALSKPVVVGNQYVVFKLLDYTQAKSQSLGAVQAKIRRQLTQSQLNQLLQQKSDQLADLVYTNPSELKTAAQTLGLKIQQSPWLSATKKPTGLLAQAKVISAAFSQDVMQQGNNSQPISLKDGSLLVLRVQARKPAYLQNIAAVKSKVVAALNNQRAQTRAAKFAAQLENAVKMGQDVRSLLKAHSLRWIDANHVSIYSTQPMPSVVAAAFAMTPGHQSVMTIKTVAGSQVVLHLVKINPIKFNQVSPVKLQAQSQTQEQMQKKVASQILLQAELKNIAIKLYI